MIKDKKYTVNIKTEEGFEQMVVEGKQVHLEGFEDVHLFYRPDNEQRDYILSEKETGLIVVRSYTVRGIKSALQKRNITQETLLAAIQKHRKLFKNALSNPTN